MERAKGFEPSTPTLARLCSTPELRPRSVGGGLLRGFRLEGKSPSIAVTTRLPRPHFHGLCHPADTTLNTPRAKQAEDFMDHIIGQNPAASTGAIGSAPLSEREIIVDGDQNTFMAEVVEASRHVPV